MLAAVPVSSHLRGPPAPSAAAQEAQAIDIELVGCGTRHSMSSWTDPKRGIGCARDLVVRRLEAIAAKSGGRLKVIVDKYETTGPRTGNVAVPMENVYAVLEGTDPVRAEDRLRHVRPPRLARLRRHGHQDRRSRRRRRRLGRDRLDPLGGGSGAEAGGFRATLIFAAVAGEEQGLLGSKRMKEWLAQQGYEVGGMITNDIVGATNGSQDRRPRVFSEGGPDGVDSPGRQMARRLDELAGPNRVRLVFRHDRFGRGGDHLPFVEAGLPAIRITEPLENYDHQHQTVRVEKGVQYGDLIQYMDFPFVAEVAALNQLLLGELAAAPAPPKSAVLAGAVTPAAKITIEAGGRRRAQGVRDPAPGDHRRPLARPAPGRSAGGGRARGHQHRQRVLRRPQRRPRRPPELRRPLRAGAPAAARQRAAEAAGAVRGRRSWPATSPSVPLLKEREGLTGAASQSSPFSFRRRVGDEVAGRRG